jgi:hypothetical protein
LELVYGDGNVRRRHFALDDERPPFGKLLRHAGARWAAQLGTLLVSLILGLPLLIIIAIIYAVAVPPFLSSSSSTPSAGLDVGAAMLWSAVFFLWTAIAIPWAVTYGIAISEVALHGNGPVQAWRKALKMFREREIRGPFVQLTIWFCFFVLASVLFRTVTFQMSLALHAPFIAFILPLFFDVPFAALFVLMSVRLWRYAIHHTPSTTNASPRAGIPVWPFQVAAFSVLAYIISHPHAGVGWYPVTHRSGHAFATVITCERATNQPCLSQNTLEFGW